MMKDRFSLWLQTNKKDTITRPEKYVSTIGTISKDLSSKYSEKIDLYGIQDIDQVVNLIGFYFSFAEYSVKNTTGNRMYSRSLDLYLEFLISYNSSNTKDIEQVLTNKSLSSTEKENIVLSRIGQGVFRKNLIKLWNSQCSITGVSQQTFLIASHIKPWKSSNNEERIDRYNGLLMLPTYDKLFDLGFISFHNDGSIIISDRIEEPAKLQISETIKIKLFPENLKYMDYHRTHVFSNG